MNKINIFYTTNLCIYMYICIYIDLKIFIDKTEQV